MRMWKSCKTSGLRPLSSRRPSHLPLGHRRGAPRKIRAKAPGPVNARGTGAAGGPAHSTAPNVKARVTSLYKSGTRLQRSMPHALRSLSGPVSTAPRLALIIYHCDGARVPSEEGVFTSHLTVIRWTLTVPSSRQPRGSRARVESYSEYGVHQV